MVQILFLICLLFVRKFNFLFAICEERKSEENVKHALDLETSIQFKMSYMTDLELVYFMANWYTCPILQ